MLQLGPASMKTSYNYFSTIFYPVRSYFIISGCFGVFWFTTWAIVITKIGLNPWFRTRESITQMHWELKRWRWHIFGFHLSSFWFHLRRKFSTSGYRCGWTTRTISFIAATSKKMFWHHAANVAIVSLHRSSTAYFPLHRYRLPLGLSKKKISLTWVSGYCFSCQSIFNRSQWSSSSSIDYST